MIIISIGDYRYGVGRDGKIFRWMAQDESRWITYMWDVVPHIGY